MYPVSDLPLTQASSPPKLEDHAREIALENRDGRVRRISVRRHRHCFRCIDSCAERQPSAYCRATVCALVETRLSQFAAECASRGRPKHVGSTRDPVVSPTGEARNPLGVTSGAVLEAIIFKGLRR